MLKGKSICDKYGLPLFSPSRICIYLFVFYVVYIMVMIIGQLVSLTKVPSVRASVVPSVGSSVTFSSEDRNADNRPAARTRSAGHLHDLQ